METRSGEIYDADQIEATIQALTDEVGRLGYAFVDIEPQLRKNPDDLTIDLTYAVNEGQRVYVERIDISGNVRTLDEVIRREFRLAEGDAFNTALLRRSQQRLRNLGFFESVDVKTVPGSGPDRVVIDTRVVERSTGELSFGAGFSTQDGLLGDIRLRERNLLGRGRTSTRTSRSRSVARRSSSASPSLTSSTATSPPGSTCSARTDFQNRVVVQRDQHGRHASAPAIP